MHINIHSVLYHTARIFAGANFASEENFCRLIFAPSPHGDHISTSISYFTVHTFAATYLSKKQNFAPCENFAIQY